MTTDMLFTNIPDTKEWVCADEDNLLFAKELIYEGDFRMGNGVEFGVSEETIDHWVNSYAKFKDLGIDVPLPKGHTDDPDLRRGSITSMWKGWRPDGKASLFSMVQFKDAEAAKAAKDSNCSIFSPAEWVDGKGNKYVRPITHVAITDYPVVPGLKGFESIAASFVKPSKKKEKIMPLKELAKRLNISCDDEAKLADTIVASFEKQGSQLKTKDEEINTLKSKVDELKPKDPVTVTAAHRTMLRDNRDLKLERAVDKGLLTPACRKSLEEMFCTDDNLNLVLSQGVDDNFEKILKIVTENDPVPIGDGVVRLSKDGEDDDDNPILKSAKRRKEAAKS